MPQKITARLSIEKRGSGKIVTVADGLPRNAGFLAGLARELKKSCGTGGLAGQGVAGSGPGWLRGRAET